MKKANFNYMDTPAQLVFDDLKSTAIEIWQTYDNKFGYVDEKVNAIKDIPNWKDNYIPLINMFDLWNQHKLYNQVKLPATREFLDNFLPDYFFDF